MPDNTDKHRDEKYWLTSVLPGIDISEAYAIEEEIITADELLERWSNFEPYELALAVNDEIRCRKKGKHYRFPITYLLCKSRLDPDRGKLVHFLRFAGDPFPFKYIWENDNLSFDFTGIAFKKLDVVNFEHDKPVFLLRRDAKAPKPYNHLAILREQFSPEGPVPAKGLTPAPQEGQESPVVPAEEPAKPRKDMTKANEARREKIEARWKDQFPIGVALTLFCLQQYGKTGKPVTQKEYEAALRQQGYDSLMIEAGEVFRKLMPPEILHRGD